MRNTGFPGLSTIRISGTIRSNWLNFCNIKLIFDVVFQKISSIWSGVNVTKCFETSFIFMKYFWSESLLRCPCFCMESLFSLLLTLFTLKKIVATTQKIGNSNITFILTFRLRAKPRLNVSFWNVLEKIMNLIRP